MDEMTTKLLTEMGVNLTTLALKGTTTAVQNKIKAIKTQKDLDSVRNSYDEIINELLSEREEAVRIAQAYKEELDKVEISEDDIVYLHNTISKILEIIKSFSNDKDILDGFEQVKELISVDTLKTMQLLGFNYKAAIGEPLTEVCSAYILSLLKNSNSSKSNRKRAK